jgi:hypothetical protein
VGSVVARRLHTSQRQQRRCSNATTPLPLPLQGAVAAAAERCQSRPMVYDAIHSFTFYSYVSMTYILLCWCCCGGQPSVMICVGALLTN